MDRDEHELEEHEEHEEHKEKEHRHKEHEESIDGPKVVRRAMESNEEKGDGVKMDGVHLKKRDMWLVAGGALGVLAAFGLGKVSGKVRPAAVGAVREGYAFKEWLAGKAEKVKEDVEDIYAEGVHQYQSGLAATADSVKREKDILEKIEQMVDAKLAKLRSDTGEGA